MSMWLAGSRVIARIEETKQSLLICRVRSVLPCIETSVCLIEVFRFEQIGLFLIGLGDQHEVIGDDGELVEDQDMSRALLRYVCDQKVC